MQLEADWRPPDWQDSGKVLFETGRMLSSLACYEMGASAILDKVLTIYKEKTGQNLLEALGEQTKCEYWSPERRAT